MKRLHIKNNHNHTFRRVLAVLLAAAMTFALAGCSPRELHIGQVEVNTGVNTAWITPARGVDRFGIPASDFSAGADGSVIYTGTAYRVLQGIDVSTFQQDIDWQAVADSGIAFAVIRAGYRGYGKGSIVEDDRFRQNVAGARAGPGCTWGCTSSRRRSRPRRRPRRRSGSWTRRMIIRSTCRSCSTGRTLTRAPSPPATRCAPRR